MTYPIDMAIVDGLRNLFENASSLFLRKTADFSYTIKQFTTLT